MFKMGNNLAIVGASYLQLPLIKKAKEMGFKTHVFAWGKRDVGEKEADYFYPISIIEKEKILKKCKEIGICGICSIASDLATITVNYVANNLGLIGNSEKCTEKSTNKYLMREAFKENGDPIPKYKLVNKINNIGCFDINYPLIVKPVDRSGSRGIYKLDNPNSLYSSIENAMNQSFCKQVLIEEFIKGQEYSVEGISFNGEHHILAITLKQTTGSPNFIETGHIEPAPLDDEIVKKIKTIVLHALDTLEIKNSASHSEVIIDDNKDIIIIEIGARMGGDMIGSDLVYYSTGVDYLKAVIDVSVGNKPDLKPKFYGIKVESKYILNMDDYNEFLDIKKNSPEKIIRIVEEPNINLLGKTTDSSNRAGCYIIRCV